MTADSSRKRRPWIRRVGRADRRRDRGRDRDRQRARVSVRGPSPGGHVEQEPYGPRGGGRLPGATGPCPPLQDVQQCGITEGHQGRVEHQTAGAACGGPVQEVAQRSAGEVVELPGQADDEHTVAKRGPHAGERHWRHWRRGYGGCGAYGQAVRMVRAVRLVRLVGAGAAPGRGRRRGGEGVGSGQYRTVYRVYGGVHAPSNGPRPARERVTGAASPARGGVADPFRRSSSPAGGRVVHRGRGSFAQQFARRFVHRFVHQFAQ